MKSKKLWIYMQNAKISESLIPILDITEYIQEGNNQHRVEIHGTSFYASVLELPNYADELLTSSFYSFFLRSVPH